MRTSHPFNIVALLLIIISLAEAALGMGHLKSYLAQGLGPVLNAPALTSNNINTLQARRLYKRYYCNTGFRCSTTSSCAFNFYWIAAVAVGLIIVLILLIICMKRKRNYRRDSNATMVDAPVMAAADPNMQAGYGYQGYQAYQPHAMYAVPKDDSNLAYQQQQQYLYSSYPATTYTPPTIYSPAQQQQDLQQVSPPTYPTPAITQPYPMQTPTSQAPYWSPPPPPR
ncbi:hypothetical protein BGZ70_000074 [Mortierella alpina]|uniref:Uncharacterized protein n=1 Tax=Mortierella alpina TaxID=64518 RepID=A0A9P6J1S7_MORAP|nr:hypothetical protein BGZ70_000074 [Mortierella alpina]